MSDGGASNASNNNKNDDENKLLLTKSLKTMIQHHVIKYYENDKRNTFYETDIDSVEMRLHFPHYINIIKQYNNDDLEYAYLIIKYLCQNGQCTRGELFDLFANNIYEIIEQKTINNINIKRENDNDDDDNNKYSFSLQFNDNDNHNNRWIRSMLRISKQDRLKQFKKQFKSIWAFLCEKRFIVKLKEQQQIIDNDNTNSRKRKHSERDSDDEEKRIGPTTKMYVSFLFFIFCMLCKDVYQWKCCLFAMIEIFSGEN